MIGNICLIMDRQRQLLISYCSYTCNECDILHILGAPLSPGCSRSCLFDLYRTTSPSEHTFQRVCAQQRRNYIVLFLYSGDYFVAKGIPIHKKNLVSQLRITPLRDIFSAFNFAVFRHLLFHCRDRRISSNRIG